MSSILFMDRGMRSCGVWSGLLRRFLGFWYVYLKSQAMLSFSLCSTNSSSLLLAHGYLCHKTEISTVIEKVLRNVPRKELSI